MKVEFLGQPFSSVARLGSVLAGALVDAQAFWAVTAWAQVSGLYHIADEIRALRDRGGSAAVIVGIDGGIATREGLELAIDLFDPAFVFHDTGSRVFHPKLFCVERPEEVLVSIGSSNLTSGGLYGNYEANVLLRLAKDAPVDRELFESIVSFRDALTTAGKPCMPLTPDLLERLAAEEALVTSQHRTRDIQRTARARADGVAQRIFGGPVTGLPGAPKRPAQLANDVGPKPRAVGVERISTDGAPLLRWSKRLTASDVLRKPETSHQRNYVALSQARHAIDHKTWFRTQFFEGVTWTEKVMRSGNLKEVALVPFEVVIDNESLGVRELVVDHADVRVADQNNSPTYLNWSHIQHVIQAHDFRGWWLELTRFSAGRFRLSLMRDEPAPS